MAPAAGIETQRRAVVVAHYHLWLAGHEPADAGEWNAALFRVLSQRRFRSEGTASNNS